MANTDGSAQWLSARIQPEAFTSFLSLPQAYSFQSPRHLFSPLSHASLRQRKSKSQVPIKGPNLPSLEHSQSGDRPLAFFTCATLSQKGGLEVISALLSFRVPWQHSHHDINMHTQKFAAGMCAHAHTIQQAKAFQGMEQIWPGRQWTSGNFGKRKKIREIFLSLFPKFSFLKVKKKKKIPKNK